MNHYPLGHQNHLEQGYDGISTRQEWFEKKRTKAHTEASKIYLSKVEDKI